MGKIKSIAVDTNFWIYLIEADKQFGTTCKKIFSYLLKENIPLLISTLTLTECFCLPFKEKNTETVNAYHQIFTKIPIISAFALSSDIAILAAQLRATYNITTPDAIHLATAINNKASLFTSNDKTLQKIKEIKVLTPHSLERLLGL